MSITIAAYPLSFLFTLFLGIVLCLGTTIFFTTINIV